MGIGISSSSSTSEQSANVFMTQQFSGTCDITCQNVLSNVAISIIDSSVSGGINITQTCATNATCMISSMSNAIADVEFSASNSSSATTAQGLWPSLFSWSESDSSSRQDIRENITQSTNESCNISSINQMNNISIFAANSTIGGGINISQNASTQGQCQLTNSMSASSYASGIAQNTSKSGKEKKTSKGGSWWLYLIIGLVVVVIVFIIGKIISSHTQSTDYNVQLNKAIQARQSLGCPPGTKAARDIHGKFIIDPRTKLPVCSLPRPQQQLPQQPIIIQESRSQRPKMELPQKPKIELPQRPKMELPQGPKLVTPTLPE